MAKSKLKELGDMRERVEAVEEVQRLLLKAVPNEVFEESWPGILHMASVEANAAILAEVTGHPILKRLVSDRLARLRRDGEGRLDEFEWRTFVADALEATYEFEAAGLDEEFAAALEVPIDEPE